MFSGLRRWWIRRKREIFVYWDGRRWRYGDPVLLDRKLMATKPQWRAMAESLDIDKLFEELPGIPEHIKKGEEEKQARTIGELMTLAREVFDLQPIADDGRGLTESGCLRVFSDFIAFSVQCLDDAGPFLSSPARPAASPAGSTIEPTAASTSPATESPSTKAELSATV